MSLTKHTETLVRWIESCTNEEHLQAIKLFIIEMMSNDKTLAEENMCKELLTFIEEKRSRIGGLGLTELN